MGVRSTRVRCLLLQPAGWSRGIGSRKNKRDGSGRARPAAGTLGLGLGGTRLSAAVVAVVAAAGVPPPLPGSERAGVLPRPLNEWAWGRFFGLFDTVVGHGC